MAFFFSLAALIVTPPWLLMILLPNWRPTKWIATSPAWVLILCVLYGLLFIPLLPWLAPTLFDPNVENVADALKSSSTVTISWIHLFAFDLLVGRQIYLDALGRQLTGWRTAPILLLTMIAGPLGYLAYTAFGLLVDDRTGLQERGRGV